MSVLSSGRTLNIPQGMEYQFQPFVRPPVALTSRLVLPSFAKGTVSAHQAENVTITATVGASLQTGVAAYGTAVGTQAFSNLSSVALSPWDNGQIHFTNISISQPGLNQNIIVGHPQLQLVDGLGLVYPSGMLISGKQHSGLKVQVVVPIWTPDGSAPATVAVNVTGLLMGTAENH